MVPAACRLPLKFIHHPTALCLQFTKRIASSQVTGSTTTATTDTVLITKGFDEDPVLVVAEHDNIDLIGPPNAASNLRPVIRKRLMNESRLQQTLREMQDATQSWNQDFWATHNTKFVKERNDYIDQQHLVGGGGEEKRQLTADEMSAFYKTFLDNNWEIHVRYNFEWYKKNFALLFLAGRVQLERKLTRLLS